MNRETELKFVGSEDTLARLRQSGELKRLAGNRRAQTTTLNGVYFDTEEHALRKAGLVLRVRNEGHGFIQTVKSVHRDDVATRMELKANIPTQLPDIEAIPESRTCWRVARILEGRALVPIFEVEVQRTRMHLSPKRGTDFEAAIDSGTIKLAGKDQTRIEPISEFELELLKGNIGDLIGCARDLTAGLSLTLSLQSKSERGYALALGKVEAPVHAFPIVLTGDATADDVLCSVIGNCLHHLLGNWTAVVQARDSEGIHQMRVALRRLRCVLSMFDEPFCPALVQLGDQARRIATELGMARDLDVFNTEILRPVAEAYGSYDRLQGFSSEVNSKRSAAWQQVIDTLESETFRNLALELMDVTYKRPWLSLPVQNNPAMQGAAEFACERLAHRSTQAMKLGERIEDLDVKERHELRIRLKKLRYAIDFTGSLFPKRRVKRFSKQLGALQDVLGQMNDAAMARALVHEILSERRDTKDVGALAYSGGLIVGWHIARSRQRMRKLRMHWRKFSKLKPFWRRKSKRSREGAGVPTD